jgi:hypothetical protein
VEKVQKVWQKPYKNVGIMFGAIVSTCFADKG